MQINICITHLSLILKALGDHMDPVSEAQLLVGVQPTQRGPRVLVVRELPVVQHLKKNDSGGEKTS